MRFYVEEGPRELIERRGDRVRRRAPQERQGNAARDQADRRQPYTDVALEQRSTHHRPLQAAGPYVVATVTRAPGTPHTSGSCRTPHHRRARGPLRRDPHPRHFKTRARVILKDLPFKPGDLFDPKLEEGERNLQTHFIFDSVRLMPVGLPTRATRCRCWSRAGALPRVRGLLALAVGVATDKPPDYAYVRRLGVVQLLRLRLPARATRQQYPPRTEPVSRHIKRSIAAA